MKGTEVKRNYKDTLFRMLYQDKGRLLELYNAVNGTSYTNSEELEIVTLENAIYMNMKNDLAFIMDFDLHLYEHQSTVNPNMPLRFLQYVTKEYEKLTEQNKLYMRKKTVLPTPHFVVFYNGIEKQPEQQEIRLSDLYAEVEEQPQLELKVLVFNINLGMNEVLLSRCQSLREYMLYVERVRRYAAEMPLELAVDLAVDDCIQEGILADFLYQNKAEAKTMSIFEYDEEAVMKLIRQEEREFGMIEGKMETILEFLRELGEVPLQLQERIEKEDDLERLGQWVKLAARAESVEDFAAKIE